MKIEPVEWLGAVGFVGALVLGLLLAAWAVGCGGSNIPIDPTCEELLGWQADARDSFQCELPAPDCSDAYNEGFDDGVDSVVECTPDHRVIIIVIPEPGEDTCDLSIPAGHRPIECRKIR